MAMPSKFTPEIQEELVAAIKDGSFLTTAAKNAGISRYTLRDWLESDDPRYAEFQTRILKAQGAAGLAREREAFQNDYKFWLLCGPCRERYNDDGTVAEEGWARAYPRRPVKCKKCAAEDLRRMDLLEYEQALSVAGVFLSREQRSRVERYMAERRARSPHAPRE